MELHCWRLTRAFNDVNKNQDQTIILSQLHKFQSPSNSSLCRRHNFFHSICSALHRWSRNNSSEKRKTNSITGSTTIDRFSFDSYAAAVSSHCPLYVGRLRTIQLFNLFPIALIMTQHFLRRVFSVDSQSQQTAMPSASPRIIRTNSKSKQ